MPVSSPPPYLDRAGARPHHAHAVRHAGDARDHQVPPERFARAHDQLGSGAVGPRALLARAQSQPPYGYLVLFDPARGFVLRLRRPPRVSLARPLEGLTITVDPGHPPGGAIGPTGLTEAAGVLPVAMKLKQILEERGAHVVMTRTTMDAVDLHLRSVDRAPRELARARFRFISTRSATA